MKNKDFAWELFKNTGNVDAFMIMRKYEELGDEVTPNFEKENLLGANDGDNKNKGDCN